MVRICHMTSAHARYDVRIFQKECVSLAKAGFQVYLVVDDKLKNEVKSKVRIVSTFHKPKNRIGRMMNSAKKVYKKALSINAEVYHLHDPELLPYGYLLKKRGKRVVFDSHENLLGLIQEKEYIPSKIRNLSGRIFVFFLKRVCKNFDAIITVDPYLCKEYQKINNNTVLVSNFPVCNENESHFKGGNKIKLVFAGGVDEQWNHIAVIKALEKLDIQIEYLFCGRADEKYLEQLKELPRWSQVSYKGVVTHEKALEILNGKNIGIALCNYSNNSNQKKGTLGNTKLFEIMMSGIPVICTKFESWEKIITEYQCGICVQDPKNSEEISNAIKYLLQHQQEAEEMGKNGQRAVKEKYNWYTQEKNLLRLYEKLIVDGEMACDEALKEMEDTSTYSIEQVLEDRDYILKKLDISKDEGRYV